MKSTAVDTGLKMAHNARTPETTGAGLGRSFEVADEPLTFSGVFSSYTMVTPTGGLLCGKPKGLRSCYFKRRPTRTTVLPTYLDVGADFQSEGATP